MNINKETSTYLKKKIFCYTMVIFSHESNMTVGTVVLVCQSVVGNTTYICNT